MKKEKNKYFVCVCVCVSYINAVVESRKKWYATAAAKLLKSCPTLWDSIDSSPPGSPIPGILQERTLEWVAISFSNAWKWKVRVKSLSRVRLFVTPWTAAYQAPPSLGFSRQEYWSGVPLPSLKKWYRWSCLQSTNRDADVENKCMDTKRERGNNWETGIDTYR